MNAPKDFRPQRVVDTSSMPIVAAPAWLRAERYPGKEIFARADEHAMQVLDQF